MRWSLRYEHATFDIFYICSIIELKYYGSRVQNVEKGYMDLGLIYIAACSGSNFLLRGDFQYNDGLVALVRTAVLLHLEQLRPYATRPAI